MNNLVTIHNLRVITTSRQVAEYFNKDHAHILRDIRKLETDEVFNASNFGLVDYRDLKGEVRQEYLITKKGFTILAFGFTGKKAMKFKLEYIDQFEAMEEQLKNINNLPNQQVKELNNKIDNLTKLLQQSQGYKSIQKQKDDSETINEINLLIKLCSEKSNIDSRTIRLSIYKNMCNSGMNIYAMAEKLNSTYYMGVVQEMGWLDSMKELTLEYMEILNSK